MNRKVEISCLLLSLVAALAVAAEVQFQHPEEWQLWKSQHGKNYQSQDEELDRHLVWLSNREYINEHNTKSELYGFSLQLNHFADLSDEEFRDIFLTYKPAPVSYVSDHTSKFSLHVKVEDLPPFVDWRRTRIVTEVKEQGQCGSSYAFSAAGAIEGAWALKHGRLVNISAQNLVDCSGNFGNSGCNGGDMKSSFHYVVSNKGVNVASVYPYIARKASCQFNKTHPLSRINGTVVIETGNEDQLQAALANVGPVSVAIDASSRSFRFYYRGVYRSQLCSSSTLNHALLAVGYGTMSFNDYWLLKNSWGEYWGINGYLLLSRTQSNHCGIATDASYPTVK